MQRNDFGINFEAVSNYLAQGYQKISAAKGRILIPLCGATGSGKSTLLNALMECALVNTFYRGVPVLETAGEPYAEIGHDGSTTSYPAVYVKENNADLNPRDPSRAFAFCDCPGFSDTRSSEMQIGITISTQIAFQLAQGIPAIIIVMKYSELDALRDRHLTEMAKILGTFFRSPMQIMNSVFFVITNAPKGMTNEGVKTRLEGVKKNLQERFFARVGDVLERARDFISAEENASMNMLGAMLDHINHFILFRPFDGGNSLNLIFERIQTCVQQRSFIPIHEFNFNQYDPLRVQFNRAIYNVCYEGIELIEHKRELKETLSQLSTEIEETAENIQFYLMRRTKIEEALCRESGSLPACIEEGQEVETERRITPGTNEYQTQIDKNNRLILKDQERLVSQEGASEVGRIFLKEQEYHVSQDRSISPGLDYFDLLELDRSEIERQLHAKITTEEGAALKEAIAEEIRGRFLREDFPLNSEYSDYDPIKNRQSEVMSLRECYRDRQKELTTRIAEIKHDIIERELGGAEEINAMSVEALLVWLRGREEVRFHDYHFTELRDCHHGFERVREAFEAWSEESDTISQYISYALEHAEHYYSIALLLEVMEIQTRGFYIWEMNESGEMKEAPRYGRGEIETVPHLLYIENQGFVRLQLTLAEEVLAHHQDEIEEEYDLCASVSFSV